VYIRLHMELKDRRAQCGETVTSVSKTSQRGVKPSLSNKKST
jgi:hypothetical protein